MNKEMPREKFVGPTWQTQSDGIANGHSVVGDGNGSMGRPTGDVVRPDGHCQCNRHGRIVLDLNNSGGAAADRDGVTTMQRIATGNTYCSFDHRARAQTALAHCCLSRREVPAVISPNPPVDREGGAVGLYQTTPIERGRGLIVESTNECDATIAWALNQTWAERERLC